MGVECRHYPHLIKVIYALFMPFMLLTDIYLEDEQLKRSPQGKIWYMYRLSKISNWSPYIFYASFESKILFFLQYEIYVLYFVFLFV